MKYLKLAIIATLLAVAAGVVVHMNHWGPPVQDAPVDCVQLAERAIEADLSGNPDIRDQRLDWAKKVGC